MTPDSAHNDWLDAHRDLVLAKRAAGERTDPELIAEINDVIVAYSVLYDASDVDNLVALFTPDGVYDTFVGRSRGHAELHERFTGFLSKYIGAVHHVSNLTVVPLPDGRVRAMSYLSAVVHLKAGVSYAFSGSYQDVLELHEGRWYIAERVVRDGLASAVEPIGTADRLATSNHKN